MIHLFMITNDAAVARRAVDNGVNRIFVDLESLGKEARQLGKNTWISHHSVADVETVRRAIPDGELLVRINPLNEDTESEIEAVIEREADFIMLPMFRTLEEVETVCDLIRGRVGFVPLVETADALTLSEEIVTLEGVTELFLGLNDLHLDRGQDFIFEPLVDGAVDRFCSVCRLAGIPFGFGGIARMDEGQIPGRLVLSEHVRLGSQRVILSRTFRRDEDGEDWDTFALEIEKLRAEERRLSSASAEELAGNREIMAKEVACVLAEKSG